MGFDTHTYPGDKTMRAWKAAPGAPYRWVGYYLPAPCHRDTSWSGKRQTLVDMGWGLAVVYVGQQTWGRTPRKLSPPRTAAHRQLEEALQRRPPQRRARPADGDDAIVGDGARGFPAALDRVPRHRADGEDAAGDARLLSRVDEAPARGRALPARRVRARAQRAGRLRRLQGGVRGRGRQRGAAHLGGERARVGGGQGAAGRRVRLRGRVAGRDRRRAHRRRHQAPARRERVDVDLPVRSRSAGDIPVVRRTGWDSSAALPSPRRARASDRRIRAYLQRTRTTGTLRTVPGILHRATHRAATTLEEHTMSHRPGRASARPAARPHGNRCCCRRSARFRAVGRCAA